MDLNNFKVQLYNGNNQQVYSTETLSGICSPPNQFVVVNYPTNGIQNGSPDGIVLVNADNNVIEFISYEGAFTAVDGFAAGVLSVDVGVSESGGTSLGKSIQRTGTSCEASGFSWVADVDESKSLVNDGQTISCVS